MIRLATVLATAFVMFIAGGAAHARMVMQTFAVLAGAGAHDVYPAPDGTVWFTAQSAGKLGRLDPRTGKSDLIALGPGAAPHGVIVSPDGAAWITEGGQNAIARVDPATRAVKLFPLPKERPAANLNQQPSIIRVYSIRPYSRTSPRRPPGATATTIPSL